MPRHCFHPAPVIMLGHTFTPQTSLLPKACHTPSAAAPARASELQPHSSSSSSRGANLRPHAAQKQAWQNAWAPAPVPAAHKLQLDRDVPQPQKVTQESVKVGRAPGKAHSGRAATIYQHVTLLSRHALHLPLDTLSYNVSHAPCRQLLQHHGHLLPHSSPTAAVAAEGQH